MRKDIQDIVEEIVLSIDKTIRISRVELFDMPNTKLFICEKKWLEVGQLILDDQGREATITTIGENFVTILKSQPFYDWTSKYFTIVKDIYYFRGTPLATNAEWLSYARNEDGKTPFVWLLEPTEEEFYKNGQGLERTSDLRLYFLDKTKVGNTVKQHHDNVLKYLNDWVDGFLLAIEKDQSFAKYDSFKTKNISRFGIETSKGYERNILDSNLCAVEVRLSLPIRNGAKCLC